MHFADRILSSCREKNSRLVVGLDPHWNLIPPSYKNGGAVEAALTRFLDDVVRVCAEHAAAFKPQIAFFEQFGVAGFQTLNHVLETIHRLNVPIILDGKRNDIGSTAAAYARAYFGEAGHPAPFPADALTLNPYLGTDGIQPFLGRPEKGVFILVKTSNPSSGEFQDLENAEGRTLAQSVARAVDGWNRATVGRFGYGNVGAVVGATYPQHMRVLRAAMPASLLLVPGFGAQGGAENAVRAAFHEDGLGALINSSRGVLFPADLEKRGMSAVAEAAKRAKQVINRLAVGEKK